MNKLEERITDMQEEHLSCPNECIEGIGAFSEKIASEIKQIAIEFFDYKIDHLLYENSRTESFKQDLSDSGLFTQFINEKYR